MNEVIQTFSVGDQVFHPLHGAGTITSIPIRQNGDRRQAYYAMHLVLDDADLLIPVTCAAHIGLRHICSKQTAQEILAGNIGPLPRQSVNWSCRQRENMARIRSGNIRQVAQVVVCLHLRGKRRALAGSEKHILECAEKILYSELMLSVSATKEEIEKKLESQWSKLWKR